MAGENDGPCCGQRGRGAAARGSRAWRALRPAQERSLEAMMGT